MSNMTPEPAPTGPGQPSPNNMPQLGATPADQGNPNAPANSQPLLAQSGNIQTDPNTGLPVAYVTVNGKLIELVLNSNVKADQPVGRAGGEDKLQTVKSALNSIQDWYPNSTLRQKYINEMYAAGLISSKKSPSVDEITRAWQLVVQESALQIMDPNGDMHLYSPDDVLAKAAQQGWNNMNAKQAPGDVQVSGTGNQNNAAETSSQSETVYKSFVDPATAMGTLADSYFRLMGRNPTPGEYNAFLHNVYTYQEQENTGKFESTSKGPSTGSAIDPITGQPVDQTGSTGGTNTNTNVVSQRGIGTRGLQFMAGQQAFANPEEGAYQAATTYFNAFIKALQGPASGMEASGPTITVP
jgi:hypothetical protein